MRHLIVRALLLSTLAALFGGNPAIAGPTFKGGRVTWASASPLLIDFSIQGSWRRDIYSQANGHCVNPMTLGVVACSGADGFPEAGDVIVENDGGTTFDPGDGTGAIGSPLGALLYLVTSVDHGSNLIYGSALDPASLPVIDVKVSHAYEHAGVYRAFLSGNGRMGPVESSSIHINNGGQPYRLETLVNVGGTAASPLAVVPPVIKCGIDSPCGFSIGAFDPTGDGLVYRFSRDFEAGAENQFVQPGPPHAPLAAELNAVPGAFDWDTTGAILAPAGSRTFYSSQVTIESLTPAITGTIPPPVTGPAPVTDTIASKIALDFLIELVETSGQPPSFEPGPIGSVIAATAGKPLRFRVDASDPDANQTLTMSAYGLPPDASFDARRAGARTRGTFAWKPAADQVGYHQVLVVVDDDGGRQVFGTVVIKVEPAATHGRPSATISPADAPAEPAAEPQ